MHNFSEVEKFQHIHVSYMYKKTQELFYASTQIHLTKQDHIEQENKKGNL